MNDSEPKLIPNYFRRQDVPFAKNAPTRTTKILSSTGLVLGGLFVLLTIYAWNAPCSFPHARSVKCATNLKQIVLTIRTYSSEHRGVLPNSLTAIPNENWASRDVLICPASKQWRNKSRVNDGADISSAILKDPTYFYCGDGLDMTANYGRNWEIVVMYESPNNHIDDTKWIAIGFLDGHIENIMPSEKAEYRAAQQAILDAEAGVRPVRFKP